MGTLSLALAACSQEPAVVTAPGGPLGPLLAIGTDPVSGARIETNKDDYAPGEIVHLTGSGWAANETVALFMTEEPNTHPDISSQVVADSAGAFSLHFYDVQEHDLGVTFTLTATGLTSGSTATAVFTDGRAISSATLNGVSAVTVAPSASISANVIGALTGNSNNTLGSIGIKVYVDGTLPSTASALFCYDVSPDKGPSTPSNSIPFNETFPFNAPASTNVYDVLVTSYSDNACATVQGSFVHTMENAITVGVSNTAPVVSAGADAGIDEGGTFAQNGSFTDPDANSWTATVDYGDGSGVQPLTLVGKTFALSHVYTDNGAFTVTVTVNDGTASDSDDVLVTVGNVAPVVSAGADFNGAAFSQGGSFTDPGADTWTATVDYGDGGGAVALALVGKTFTLSHTYVGSGNYTVTVTVTDDDTGAGSDQVIVNVANTAPVVSAGADDAIDEGGTFSRNGSFTDPDADSWTATVDYDDGSGVQPLTLVGKTFALSHVYADNGTFNVTVTVNDGTATGSDVVVLTVNNVAPVVSAGNDATVTEGATFSRNGSFTDPGADTWTATVDYGDGAGPQALALVGKTFALSHVYADDGSYTVTVTVTDDDGGSDSDQVVVTVDNVAPVITSVVVPVNPVAAGPNNVTVTWAFTDPGADTWTCEISWDTGLPYESATYAGSKSCSATNTLPAGIYTITVKVSDDDGGSDTEPALTYVVVYDPNGGFVTGGGWIASPPGALTGAPALSGKATFGFVSKYLKGASKPSGNTEFQFHAAGLEFKSTVYDWLVISGARGQYKGTGTINGSGNYGFLLTAIDGQLNGGNGTDKFRIKIWDLATSAVVYDNQMGALDDSPAATALSGGSIVIHSK
jgi:PKD repeat protein